MYRTATWDNDTIRRIVSREIIHGLTEVFEQPEGIRVFLHDCRIKHVFDGVSVTEDIVRNRLDCMLGELNDPDHTYVFDSFGSLMLYFAVNAALEHSQDTGIEWESAPVTDEEEASAKKYLQEFMTADLTALGGLQPAQIKTLLRGYVPALMYIVTHFPEYNSEFGMGSYADILTHNFVYHNMDFKDLADNGWLSSRSHFPAGNNADYKAVSGSAQYSMA